MLIAVADLMTEPVDPVVELEQQLNLLRQMITQQRETIDSLIEYVKKLEELYKRVDNGT